MKIIEIFQSLQGEGKNQGKTYLFIRLAGCNLNCRWCDTPDARSGWREMSTDTILERIWRTNPSYVCITGGEPLLQVKELKTLLASLHKKGIVIDIETNGTIDFSDLQPYASICMDVKCPSSGETSFLELLERIRPADSVKFVVKDTKDCAYAMNVLNIYRPAGELFFSPVFGTDYAMIARFILDNDLPVRFQIQLHKVIGVK